MAQVNMNFLDPRLRPSRAGPFDFAQGRQDNKITTDFLDADLFVAHKGRPKTEDRGKRVRGKKLKMVV